MSGVALNLYDPLLYGGGVVGNFTSLFESTWRRSIRRRGGFYIGTTEITSDQWTRAEMEEFFRYGLLREIREGGGGQETWRGFIAKMEYSRGGYLYTNDITRMSNAVKVIYTRIFDNLLTNGSGESGAWASYGGGTVTQITTWRADGTYSIRIQSAGGIQGAKIQATIAVVANQTYLIEGRLHLISGSWRVSANRADNDASLAFFSTRGGAAGDYTVSMTIPAVNTYTGNVDLRITSEGSAGDIYGDAFSFRVAPIPNTQTGWYEDALSITVHGRKENPILEIGKTSDAANAEAQSYVVRWAWPQPYPPNNYTQAQAASQGDKLTITFAGYWATLNWLSIPLGIDTGTINGIVTSLVNLQSTYVVPNIIDANATLYAIDNRGTLLAGDALKDIAGDGKAGGALYGVGVYAGRKFNYQLVEPVLTYHIRDGQLYSNSGSLYEPWLAQPGYALVQDLPIGPGTLAAAQNDPRWVYLEEIEMIADPNTDYGYKLAYNLEPAT